MAQIAQEADARRALGRQNIEWQPKSSHLITKDVVDGHGRMEGVSTFEQGKNPLSAEFYENNVFNFEDLPSASTDNRQVEFVEMMEQEELDEITESEIDSPIREEQIEKRKKKDKASMRKTKTKKDGALGQLTKENKQEGGKQPAKTYKHIKTSIFDFSSEDDDDMSPNVAQDKITGGLELDDFTDEVTVMEPGSSVPTETLVASRNVRSRKGTRQQTKGIEESSNVGARKGSRKRITRAQK